jgi:hypothetical protein
MRAGTGVEAVEPAAAGEGQGPAAAAASPLATLLSKHGLQQHAAVLKENGFALADVSKLTSDDLKEMGVAKLKERKAMLEVFAQSGGGGAPAPPKPVPSLQVGAALAAMSAAAAGGGAAGGAVARGGARRAPPAPKPTLVRQTTADGWATAAGKKAKPQFAGSTLAPPQRADLPKECKKYLDVLWRWKVLFPYSVHCACGPAFC